MKLSISLIEKSMNKSMYSRACSLHINHCVYSVRTSEARGAIGIAGFVSDRGEHYAKAVFDPAREYLRTDCDCLDSRLYGICSHAGALLIEYCLKSDRIPEPSSSSQATALLEAYSPLPVQTEQKAVLLPMLSLEGSVPTLSFKIGSSEGMYIIKDLIDFSSRMERGQDYEYGAKFVFDHNRAAFDSDSLFWCDFIGSRTSAIASAVTQTTGTRASRLDLRELPLNGRDFDLLYEKMLPSRHIANRSSGRRFNLCDGNPGLKLSMKRSGGSYTLDMEPRPLLIKGAEHDYVAIQNDIWCLSDEYSKAMTPIIKAVQDPEMPPVFTKKGAEEFCMKVLPAVERFTEGSELTVLDDIRPEDVEIKYLLDLPERGRLTASVNFTYGDRFVAPNASDTDYPDIRRNLNLEQAAKTALAFFFGPPAEDSGLYEMTDEERMYDFLREGMEKLAKTGEVYVTDRLKNMNIERTIRPVVKLKIDDDLLNFGVDTGEFPQDELAQLLRCVREKRRYYRLRDGRFMGLENGAMSSVTDAVDDLGLRDSDLIDGSATLPMYRAMYLDTAFREARDIQSVERDSSFKRLIRDFRTVEDSDFEVPEDLDSVMRPYQKTGFRWLRTLDAYRFGGILADDMGLGKTLQVLSYLSSLKNEGKLNRASLIVCPASLVLNWGDEAEKWTPGLRTCLLMSGSPLRNRITALQDEYDLIVTSYDLLRRDIDTHAKCHYYACILDEAQYIKNQETQIAKAVRRITADVHFALSGTPVENRLSELWSVFEFLMPGYLDRYSRFRDRYEKPITAEDSVQARAALKRLVNPFILRRMKTDVLDELPPKTEMNCYIEMGEKQRELYLAWVKKTQEVLGSGQGAIFKVLPMLMRLRQICCDPDLCFEDYEGTSSKLDECLRMSEELISGGHRILIFSQFTSMLSRIDKGLAELGIESFTLKGDTPLAERASLVRRFNAGEVPVFLISLKAGGTGLNLTGADTVIHYDPWWNVSAQNQATDRCYRIGQNKAVTVYKLIAKDTIEENIIRLQDKKLNLAKVVNENSDGSIMDMSREELLELLSTDHGESEESD